MITLRIEHDIRDYDMWKAAFDGFADARDRAGVRSHAIRRPHDDAHHLMLDLEFDSTEQAGRFADFLEREVWSSPTAAPALIGVPRTRVLVRLDGQ